MSGWREDVPRVLFRTLFPFSPALSYESLFLREMAYSKRHKSRSKKSCYLISKLHGLVLAKSPYPHKTCFSPGDDLAMGWQWGIELMYISSEQPKRE